MDIYLYKRGQRQGPYSLDQIKAWLVSGQVQATAMAWCAVTPDYVPLYCMPGIKDDPQFSPYAKTVTSENIEIEEQILRQTIDEIDKLRERIASTPVAERANIQNRLQYKLNIYWKQAYTFKAQFPDTLEAKKYEGVLYFLQAMAKFDSVGFLRQQSAKTGSVTWGIVSGLLANQQERANATEALALLDKSISIFDSALGRLVKAGIYSALNQNEYALRELNYIIANFRDDENYIEARQAKDEIEVGL